MLINLTLVVLAAYAGSWIVNRVGLPAILGMIAAGAVLGPSGIDQIDPAVIALLAEFKIIALIIILLRAGLGIRRSTLTRIGGAALRLGALPATLEGIAVAAAGYYWLDLSWTGALLLGLILAALSPAIVVPQMLTLQERGYGARHDVPTLILAAASMDNVLVLTLAGLALAVAAGASVGPAYALLIVLAAGLLLRETNSALADKAAAFLRALWVPAELLLFVYIGAAAPVGDVSVSLIGSGLLILMAGLLVRSLGVWLSLLGTDLDRDERAFCVIAYLPKATVQAALAAVPLSLVAAGTLTAMTVDHAESVLSIAVLAIVVTTPLGAIAIRTFGPRLLQKDSH